MGTLSRKLLKKFDINEPDAVDVYGPWVVIALCSKIADGLAEQVVVEVPLHTGVLVHWGSVVRVGEAGVRGEGRQAAPISRHICEYEAFWMVIYRYVRKVEMLRVQQTQADRSITAGSGQSGGQSSDRQRVQSMLD
jgi:hypothetical protein